MSAVHSWWHDCGILVDKDHCSDDPAFVTCKRCLAAMKKNPNGLRPVPCVEIPIDKWNKLVNNFMVIAMSIKHDEGTLESEAVIAAIIKEVDNERHSK